MILSPEVLEGEGLVVNWSRDSSHRLAALAAGVVLAAVAAGMFFLLRDDSPSAQTLEGPSVLSPSDIRGEPWVATEDQVLGAASASSSALQFSSPRDAACAGFRKFELALADLDGGFIQGATRTMERHDGQRLLATTSHTVVTFRAEASIDGAIDELRTVFASPDFISCLLKSAELAGSTPELESVALSAPVPNGGAGVAVRYRVASSSEGGEMVHQIMWWRSGRLLSALVVSSWDPAVDVAGVVEAAKAAISASGSPGGVR